MFFNKISGIFPSTLTLLTPWMSSPSSGTDETTHCPVTRFFDQLRLETLTYDCDSETTYADDLPSLKLPLAPRPFHEGQRKLQFILKLEYLPEEVEYFFSDSEPIQDTKEDIMTLKLSLAYNSSEMSKAFGFNPYHIYDRRDILFAMEHGPIRSAEKLAATINKDISDFHFIMPRRNPLLHVHGIDPMLFTYYNPVTNEKNYVRCIIVPLAPWEFTSEDFKNFTRLGVFTDGSDNAELMWSYIHDLCAIHDCDYFVLTTYENWAFGRFAHTYVQGFISEPISRTSKDSVMKYLTYWILNSCYTTDTAVIQEIIRRELEYNLVKIRVKSSDENDGQEEREHYQIALINRRRITGRPHSPDPFPDSSDFNEEMLPRPQKKGNRWYKDDDVLQEKVVGDNVEEIAVPSALMKDLDISDCQEMAVMEVDAGPHVAASDPEPDQAPQESTLAPTDLVDSDIPT